jgi:Tfp pilus assembly protein PilF
MKRKVSLFAPLFVIVAVCLSGCATKTEPPQRAKLSPGLKIVLEEQNYKEAIPVLEQEYADDPKGILSTTQIGVLASCYNMVGQPEKTLDLMKSALKKAEDSRHVETSSGTVVYDDIGILESTWGRPVDVANFYAIMGDAYVQFRRYGEAIDSYKKALEHHEKSHYHGGLASVYMMLGYFDLAVEEWKLAIRPSQYSKYMTSEQSVQNIRNLQEIGNLDYALRGWKSFIMSARILPNYIDTEDIGEEFRMTPEQIRYAEQQIEILEKQLHPETFSGPSFANRLDAYAESVTQYLLNSSLAQGEKELRITIGDFIKDRVDEKPKLGHMFAASLTEKLNQSGMMVVTQGEGTTGGFYLFGVIQDLGSIVIIRTYIFDSEGKQAVPSPEPLELAKDSEVTDLLQAGN